MIGRFVFIGALALAPMAAAQTPAASPAQVAEARARADQLIANAEAGGVFVNKTDSAVAAVRHAPSGMACLLGEADRIHVFPQMNGRVAAGEDVACIMREDDLEITTYATRYPGGMNTTSIVSNAVSGIRQRWPDAVPYEGEIAMATVQDLEAPGSAAFKVEINGEPMLTMVLGAQVGEWSYKVRVTGPYDDAMSVSMRGAIAMAFIQMKLKDAE